MGRKKKLTREELMQYCYFYKGEDDVPESFNRDEGKLWMSEYMICHAIRSLVDPDDPQRTMAQAVVLHLGKWDPYGFRDVMKRYFQECPELEGQIFVD